MSKEGNEVAQTITFPSATWERGKAVAGWNMRLALMVVLLAGGTGMAEADENAGKIHVIFLGGFNHEQVELFSGNQKVYSADLTTSPVTGAAGGPNNVLSATKLSVSLPRLALKKEIDLTPNGGSFVYVFLDDDKLRFEQHKTPAQLD